MLPYSEAYEIPLVFSHPRVHRPRSGSTSYLCKGVVQLALQGSHQRINTDARLISALKAEVWIIKNELRLERGQRCLSSLSALLDGKTLRIKNSSQFERTLQDQRICQTHLSRAHKLSNWPPGSTGDFDSAVPPLRRSITSTHAMDASTTRRRVRRLPASTLLYWLLCEYFLFSVSCELLLI